MSVDNAAIMARAIKRFEKKKMDELQQKLKAYADDLLESAVRFRFERTYSSPAAHNFTGNLVSSIAVGLWRKGKLVHGVIAGSQNQVTKVWRRKMTGPDRWYKFRVDWDTNKNTMYHAEVVTDEGFGRDDARRFLDTHRPGRNEEFHLAVAYTVEYAEWVETKRHTTGYMETVEWINMTIDNAVTE